MRSVLGYGDRLAVCAGDRIRFSIAARSGEVEYDADVVRLGSAVERPRGPGSEEFELADAPRSRGVARAERIDRGSRAVVPASAALAGTSGLTLQAVIWPTAPGVGEQALVGTWNERERAGHALCLAADGSLALRAGAGRGGFAEHATRVPLRAREWAHVAAIWDAAAGSLRLIQEPLGLPPSAAVLAGGWTFGCRFARSSPHRTRARSSSPRGEAERTRAVRSTARISTASSKRRALRCARSATAS
jgi:N,N-dimethylformamidase